MKHIFTLFILLSFSGCLSSSTPEKTLTPPSAQEEAPLNSPEDLLNAVSQAQERFYTFCGRYSMEIDTLVKQGFLTPKAADYLTGRQEFMGWNFSQTNLPFPDEDVKWSFAGKGPNGRVLLVVADIGLWERNDGQLPLERESLPPKAPWKRVD